jgi:hypothetical protein
LVQTAITEDLDSLSRKMERLTGNQNYNMRQEEDEDIIYIHTLIRSILSYLRKKNYVLCYYVKLISIIHASQYCDGALMLK